MRLPLLSAVLLAAALAAPFAAMAQNAAKVGVDAVRRETVSQTMPVLGRLVAKRAGVVAARVAGPVEAMRVAVGDRVEAGQVLAVQEQNRLQATRELRRAGLAESEAQLRSARSQVEMAAVEMRRLETLKQNRSPAFPQARYDDKAMEVAMLKSRIAEAAARIAQAKANLSLAEIALRESEIRAPYAGVVTLRHTEAGAYLNPGSDVVSLIAADALEVEADVPVSRLAALTPGATVGLRIGGELGEATVRAVVPEENPLTRTRAVRFTPLGGMVGIGLAANQSADVLVPISAAAEALTVHKDAVLKRGGQSLVFVVADGAATPRPVQLGEAAGARFVVLEGLSEGDVVVTRGNERLRPGQPVSY